MKHAKRETNTCVRCQLNAEGREKRGRIQKVLELINKAPFLTKLEKRNNIRVTKGFITLHFTPNIHHENWFFFFCEIFFFLKKSIMKLVYPI